MRNITLTDELIMTQFYVLWFCLNSRLLNFGSSLLYVY
jgi:hypothetical protein